MANILIMTLTFLSILPLKVLSVEIPLIYPIPLDVQINGGKFYIDKTTFIAVPEKENNTDDFLAKLLSNELGDKFQQSIIITKKQAFAKNDKFILIGDITNPLIRSYCEQNALNSILRGLGHEGYILSVSENNVVVAANSREGSLFGFESLRQIISKDEKGNLSVPQLVVKDSPQFTFRGIRLYLPGRENIPFFKRFIKNFAALYKFNKIILELNANMRLDSHPELNIGVSEFYNHLKFSRLNRPPGKHMEFQDSSHADNADGGVLEKEEVADLVKYMKNFNMEVIPEMPSLTHAYYLLARHEDLAENLEQPYPDTYCPLKPEIYKIYFDVLDEYIDVIHPSIIHIGHDEWRVEKNTCALCRGKDYGYLFANDVIKIHGYLEKKGIKTALWGDHLLESARGKDHQEWESSVGYKYNIPGALTPEQVLKLIPKDILVFNWFWDDINNDKQISDFGFKQVYGNFMPWITKWDERVKTKGLLGGASSSWAATTEMNFGKDLIYDFLGTANLLWSKHYLPPDDLALITQTRIGEVRNNLSGKLLPGDAGINVKMVDISSFCNTSMTNGIDSLNHADLLIGSVNTGDIVFNLDSNQERRAIAAATQKAGIRPNSVLEIQINKDVNSIIFLHACAKPGFNEKAFNMINNFDDTAQLLGWYEIIYEDGFVETVPIRYGVNILDWGWRQRVKDSGRELHNIDIHKYVYGATAITCSKENANPITFYAFEWENKRYGKRIKEINLKSVNYTKNNENAIILLGITVSDNTQEAEAKGTE